MARKRTRKWEAAREYDITCHQVGWLMAIGNKLRESANRMRDRGRRRRMVRPGDKSKTMACAAKAFQRSQERRLSRGSRRQAAQSDDCAAATTIRKPCQHRASDTRRRIQQPPLGKIQPRGGDARATGHGAGACVPARICEHMKASRPLLPLKRHRRELVANARLRSANCRPQGQRERQIYTKKSSPAR